MNRWIRLLLPGLLLLLFAGGYWLLGTEAGLRWAWAELQGRAGGAVSAERVEGILAGPVRVQGLTVRTAQADVAVGRLALDWSPTALLGGTFKLARISAEQVRIQLPETGPAPETGGDFALPALPLTLAVEEADVRDVLVQRAGQEPLHLERVTLTGRLGPEGLALEHLGVRSPQGGVTVRGEVGRQPGQPVDLTAEWSAAPEPLVRPVSGSARIGGSIAKPRLSVRVDAPFRAEGEGRVHWQDTPLAWDARLSLEGLEPAALNPGWPALRLDGTAEAEGGAQSWRANGTAGIASPAAGPWQARWALSREGPQWRISQLRLSSKTTGAHLSASGSWRQSGGIADVEEADLRAKWQGLGWPLREPAWTSREGQLRVTGRPDRYRVGLEAQAEGDALGPSRWRMDGAGDLAGIRMEKIVGELLGGKAEGSARVKWRPALQWSARMALQGIDPGSRWPAWGGRLSARLGSKGELDRAGLVATASVEELSGELRGYPVRGGGGAELRGGRFILDRLDLASGSAQLTASGAVGERWDMAWRVQAPDLAHAAPEVTGSLESRGRLSGPREAPSIAASVTGRELAWRDRRVASLSVEADLDLAGAREWIVDASAGGMALGTPAGLTALELSARGRPDRHRIRLRAGLEEGEAGVTLAGALEGREWSGTVEEGLIRLQQVEWEQQAPASLHLSPAGAAIEPWCWSHPPGSRLCLSGRMQEGAWQGRLALTRFPLQHFTPWLPERALTVRGALTGEAALAGAAGTLERIDVALNSPGGRLEYVLEEQSLGTDYRDISLRIQGTLPEGIGARASIELNASEYVRASAGLPGWMPGVAMAPQQPLQGELAAQLRRTQWLGLLLPDAVISEGVLDSRLDLAGTLADPQLSGQGRLQQAKVVLPALGISLESLRFALRPAPGAAAVASLQVRSGPGELTAEGRVEVSETGRWGWAGTVAGERFEVLRLPLGRALASPDLELDVAPGRVRVAGSVAIPEARIALPELPEGAVRVSPDVVVVDRPAPEEGGQWQIATDVQIRFGEAVRVEGYGFSGRLGGSLRIVETQPGAARASGEVRILDGRYEAYGQELTITQGRLFYAAMPLDNPGLDFRAVRELSEVTVGILVGGRLQMPEVSLFSEPPMEESDQLAYLLLGRPLSTASREEAGSLQSAAASLGLAGGGRIAREIGSQFGLDVVEVGAEEDIAGTEQAALVLGKYLHPRLYIQYAVGIWEAVNTVRVRYRLGRNWVLEAASGPQSSTDLLYSIER